MNVGDEEQGSNFTFSPNNVNNVEVRLYDIRKPKDDNVIEIELDSILVACSHGFGNDNVDEMFASTQFSGGRLTSYV